MKNTNARLMITLSILASSVNLAMAQWTPPTLYVKGATDQWQTSSPDYSGYTYSSSLEHQIGGTVTKFWRPSYQFQQTYNTSGWYVSYLAYQWAGSTYQFKTSQYGTWQCCEPNLPWGDWQKLQSGQQSSGSTTWSRSKDLWLDVATGGSERGSKYLLLNVSGFAFTGWANGANGPAPTGAGYPLTWDQFTVMGGSLNPDQRRFRKVTANSTVDATPSSSANSYGFSVTIESHKRQTLSVSRHPNASNRDWQTAFDIGSDALGKDDDGNGNTGSLEDQGCYVEFLIKPAASPTFTAAFQTDEYNNVRTQEKAGLLASASFANLKTVSSIIITENNSPYSYYGWSDDIPGTSAALTASAPAIAGVHEYGHLCGLNHRGTGNNTQGYDPANAIMATPIPAGASEVNGYELGYFEGGAVTTLGL